MNLRVVICNAPIKTNQLGIDVIDNCFSWFQMKEKSASSKKRLYISTVEHRHVIQEMLDFLGFTSTIFYHWFHTVSAFC